MSARTFAPAMTLRRLLTVLAVTATVGAGTAAHSGVASTTAADSIAPLPSDDQAIVHLLNRATYGFSAKDLDTVRRMGIAGWTDEQLNPDRIQDDATDTRLSGMPTLRMSTAQLARDYFAPAQLDRRARQQAGQVARDTRTSPAIQKERQVLAELAGQKLLRAVYSERQLQEVLVDFWFNHFNVFVGKGQTRVFLTEYERDAIRPHVLGRFRDLLGATAKSPAMLFYLDNWMSADPQAARVSDTRRSAQPPRRKGLNENYARELLELHTLGVDGGYTQADVTEVARAFTGWTIDQPRAGGGFRFVERLHANGPKQVLGRRIGVGGQGDGEAVLDVLARHPSTARFIAAKLARRFVSDDPPESLVARAARRFTETDGSLREVVRTILAAPEFFAPEARRAKVKTPLEFVVSALRATGAAVADARPALAALRELGMAPYSCQPPTGYADRADAWVNAGALLGRMNVALQFVNARGPALRVDAAAIAGGDGAIDASAAALRLIGTPASDATRAQVGKATSARQVVALLLGSPEFQKR